MFHFPAQSRGIDLIQSYLFFAAAVTLPIDKRGRYQVRSKPTPQHVYALSDLRQKLCVCATFPPVAVPAGQIRRFHLKASSLSLTLRSHGRSSANSEWIYCTYGKKKPMLPTCDSEDISLVLCFLNILSDPLCFFCCRITRQHCEIMNMF